MRDYIKEVLELPSLMELDHDHQLKYALNLMCHEENMIVHKGKLFYENQQVKERELFILIVGAGVFIPSAIWLIYLVLTIHNPSFKLVIPMFFLSISLTTVLMSGDFAWFGKKPIMSKAQAERNILVAHVNVDNISKQCSYGMRLAHDEWDEDVALLQVKKMLEVYRDIQGDLNRAVFDVLVTEKDSLFLVSNMPIPDEKKEAIANGLEPSIFYWHSIEV